MTLAQQVTWSQIIDFSDYGALLSLSWKAILAGAVLGLVGGLVSVFVMMRDLPFAVHGVSELSFAGAAGFLLMGANVVAGSVTGSLIAAFLIGVLGARARDRNSIIGVLMPFGLGLGVLFLSLYSGRTANKFGLLVGQIAAVDSAHLVGVCVTAAIVLTGLVIIWRPLTFASTDPGLAAARGVPVRVLSPVFMLLLGLTVAISVQAVGALLVLTILCTPAAAAMRVTSSPVLVPVLSIAFAVTSMVGGILLEIGSTRLPITPYVTTLSFAIYAVCRGIGTLRDRRGWDRPASSATGLDQSAGVVVH
jgi:zinc/manganese transport system permease protein